MASIGNRKIEAMTDRVILLEGIHNFRDSGGYPVAGGGRLRRGRLWRSGQHHGATDSDLETVCGLGLVAVFDLRGDSERASHPCRRPEGFAARVFQAQTPERRHAPHIAAAQVARQRTPESTRESLRRNYDTICFRPELVAMMRRYVAEVASGSGPTLVNCMAGKDRTGIAVAMLHSALGVGRDDILEDYLLTNTAGDSEARIRAGAETVRAVTGQVDDAVLRVLMGVEAEYLERAFAAIAGRYGSTEAYLEQELGVDGRMREALRAAMVEA